MPVSTETKVKKLITKTVNAKSEGVTHHHKPKVTDFKTKREQEAEMDMGARRYAAMDNSDPFAYARAKAHMRRWPDGRRNICTFANEGEKKGEGYYNARAETELRQIKETGETYKVTVFKDGSRP